MTPAENAQPTPPPNWLTSPPPLVAGPITPAAERQYPPGERIAGRYEVVKVLTGGMGVVYLCADHEREGLPVALKTFKPKYLPDRATRDRFLREGTIWVGLGHHPNIVRAYRVERLRGGLEVYLVLEWVAAAPGKEDASLRAWLQRGRSLPPERSLHFALHIARGMHHATTRIPGLVHRDMKPENVLIGRDGNARVTDFGLAGVLAALKKSLQAGGGVGTPPYMAPEQWDENAPLDPRTDIYAFGCILFEMLTGQMAAPGKTTEELARVHQTGDLRPLPDTMSPQVKALLRGCLALYPEKRFASWQDVETAVSLVIRHTTGEPPQPLSRQETKTNARSERIAAGWSYDAMGLSYHDIGNHDLAAGYFDRVIWIGKQEKEPSLVAAGLSHLGDACYAMGDLQGAIEYHRQHLALAQKLGLHASESDAWGNLGQVYAEQGDIEQAMTCYQKQLALVQEIRDRPREGEALSNLGDTCLARGETAEALRAYKRALAITRETEDPLKEGRLLSRVGRAYHRLGQTERATQYTERGLAIARDIGDRTGEGLALRNLGEIERQQGNLQQAIWHFINYLSITQEIRDRVGEARVLCALGDIYHQLDNLEQAIESYQSALRIVRSIGNHSWQAQILQDLGIVYRRQHKPRQAIGFFEEALTLLKELDDHARLGELACRLANTYRDTGDLRRARRSYELGLQTVRKTGDERLRARLCFGLAVALARADQRDEAIHYAELAAYTFQQLGETQALKKTKDLLTEIRPRRRWF